MFGEIPIDEYWNSGGGQPSDYAGRGSGFAIDAFGPRSRDLYNLDMIFDWNAYADRQIGPETTLQLPAGSASANQPSVPATTATVPSGPGQQLASASLLLVPLVIILAVMAFK